MRSGQDLISALKIFKREVPKEISLDFGEVMFKQTKESFRNERFEGENGSPKWEDRHLISGKSAEPYLNYKKLDYTGRLKRSFSYKSVRTGANRYIISLNSNDPKAKLHNEGGRSDRGYVMRSPPKATQKIAIRAREIVKRQFMGIGDKTLEEFGKVLTKKKNQYCQKFL